MIGPFEPLPTAYPRTDREYSREEKLWKSKRNSQSSQLEELERFLNVELGNSLLSWETVLFMKNIFALGITKHQEVQRWCTQNEGLPSLSENVGLLGRYFLRVDLYKHLKDTKLEITNVYDFTAS